VAKDQVFISYSHKNKRWRDDLVTTLKPYLRDGSIVSWSDEQITAGSKWFREIKSALANTRVAVLLVTPNFLASDFIHEYELGTLLKEAEQGGVKILWVPVYDSGYKKTALKNYQAVLDPKKPLAGMSKAKRDQAWVKVCEEIEKALGRTDEPRHSPNLEQSEPSGQPAPTAAGQVFSPSNRIPPSSSSQPALGWRDFLGHTYQGTPPAIYTQAIDLNAKNVSNRPVQLEQAYFTSDSTPASIEAKVVTSVGLLDPSQTTPILPGSSVTLRAEFNSPTGLPAQEFMKVWGQMVLHVKYDCVIHRVPIGEHMTRSLFTGFQPSPLEPTVTRAITTENTGLPDPALDFLMRLATENAREAMKRCWSSVGKAILNAVKATGDNTDPGSPEVKNALNQLESSVPLPEGVVQRVKELWRKAHIIFYQSPWAWDPQSKEAQEFILSAAAVRNDLERHTF
jgi:hypothetical protein